MCEFEILTSTFRSCTLRQYGRAAQPHQIISKFIHQCVDPRPERGSDSTCCEERFQTDRTNVEDSGDRGQTKATGDCPACKAAEEKCLNVYIVPNPGITTMTTHAIQLATQQQMVEHPAAETRVTEQNGVVEVDTNQTIETKKPSRPRDPAGPSRSHTSHARRKDNGGCIVH